jgi:serine protease
MIRPLLFAFLSLPLAAAPISTHCQMTEDVPISHVTSIRHLVGCGSGFPDNLLWSLDRIDQRDGPLNDQYDTGNGGLGAVIYVVDTGVLASHDQFMTATGSRVVAGLDAVTGKTSLPDEACVSPNRATEPCFGTDTVGEANVGHGTSVASIAVGNTIGVAPQATMIAVRAVTTFVNSSASIVYEALRLIAEHASSPSAPPFQTAVVNMSFAFAFAGSSDPRIQDVQDLMRIMTTGVDASAHADPKGKRFLFVVAPLNVAGGCPKDGLVNSYPALWGPSIDGLITVGGMTEENKVWSGGCAGPAIELVAPATNILSAYDTAHDHYRATRSGLSGTSFSTAIVSGVAARMLSLDPTLTPQQLEAKLESRQSVTSDEAAMPVAVILPPPPVINPRRRAATH